MAVGRGAMQLILPLLGLDEQRSAIEQLRFQKVLYFDG
jgi:hypothetical protein